MKHIISNTWDTTWHLPTKMIKISPKLWLTEPIQDWDSQSQKWAFARLGKIMFWFTNNIIFTQFCFFYSMELLQGAFLLHQNHFACKYIWIKIYIYLFIYVSQMMWIKFFKAIFFITSFTLYIHKPIHWSASKIVNNMDSYV